jgi:hypothetical protein
MKEMKDHWLKCRVLKGMFSDEGAVVFKLSDEASFFAFVPYTKVRGEIDREGEVKVDVFEEGNTTWAILPTEYRDTVPVPASGLANSSSQECRRCRDVRRTEHGIMRRWLRC